MTKQKIFFSYSRLDGAEFALRLALDLKKNGYDVWIDQEDIRAGSEWDLEVEKALITCDCLLFIETEKSVNSNNVLDEVYYALEHKKKVIPIILLDSKTPFRLQRLQHINFAKDYDSGLAHLISELEHSSSATGFLQDENTYQPGVHKPFYEKYRGLILLIASTLIIAAGAVIFITKNNSGIIVNENNVINLNDTTTKEQPVDSESNSTVEQNVADNNDITNATAPNKHTRRTKSDAINNTVVVTGLNENFIGDWELVDVTPKARLKRGYLKIEAVDEKKVAIKTNLQFYYLKTNKTSFLSVFNAFAGCSSCAIKKDMTLTVEDVSIGSRVIKTLTEDQPDGQKAGDTIMDAGLNKSIKASVSLQLLNNNSATITVKKTNAVQLADDLVLEPFVYRFTFRKSE